MSITFQRNPDGIIAVYSLTTYRDERDGKKKPKKIYLGTMKNNVFVPTNHKNGPSRRDVSEPIEFDKDLETEIKLLYLEAENRRLNELIAQIGTLIQPTLESISKEENTNGPEKSAKKSARKKS